MEKILNFAMDLSNFEFQEYLDEDLALLRILVVDDNPNAHNFPISYEAIKDAAPTLTSKALVAKYDKYEGDVLGHEKDEVPIGFFPKQDFEFVENEDGSHSMYAYAILFKTYCEDVYNLFTSKVKNGYNPIKSVSMEIKVLESSEEFVEGEKTNRIDKFSFKGVTLLGNNRKPAIYNANAEMVCFSQRVNEANSIYFANNTIKIDNSKEASVNSSSWTNPRKKIIFKIIKSSKF